MDNKVVTLVSFFAIGVAIAIAARFIFMLIMEKGTKKNGEDKPEE